MRSVVTFLLGLSLSTFVVAARGGEGQRHEPEVEVSSVRHNTSGFDSWSRQWQARRFSATNIKLETLVLMAFDIPSNLARHLVIGGLSDPLANCTRNCSSRNEILTARFDVQATFTEDVPGNQSGSILRKLLQERFKLKAHLETREISVYSLTVAREGRLGPQLRRSEQDCAVWYRAKNASLEAPTLGPTDAQGRPLCGRGPLARMNEFIYVRRGAGDFSALVNEIRGDLALPIVDRTGLEGKFEWELTSEIPGIRELASSSFVGKAPTLDIALQEQLGLRLQRSTAPFQVLVIESVSMPAEN